MKRKLSLLATGALLLIGLVFVPMSPASASADVCVGNGTATTDNPVTYPVVGGSASGGVHFNFALGGCLLTVAGVASHSGTVNGNFTAGPVGNYCGHSTGHVDAWGHGLDWVSVGSMLVLSNLSLGGGLGVVNATPNATGPDGSCLTGAKNFLVTGVLVLLP